MVVASCYVDTLLGEEPSLTPGTETLQANNQTLATGDSGGDTVQLVSSSLIIISSLELQSPPAPVLAQHLGPDRHLLPPQLPGRHPGRGRGRVRANKDILSRNIPYRQSSAKLPVILSPSHLVI